MDENHGLSSEQMENIRSTLQIQVEGSKVVDPIVQFSDVKLPKKLVENMSSVGYLEPTPIQMQCIPVVLEKRDILACAPTGSGKTAAFVLPIIVNIIQDRYTNTHLHIKRSEIQCIVLSPTRELCQQIERVVKDFAVGLPVKTALIVGGFPMPPQIHRLKNGVDMITATPNRLIEIMKTHSDVISFDSVNTFVVDEVDRMLDSGFIEQVLTVKTALNPHQTLMFSATIPKKVKNVAQKMMENHVFVSVAQSTSPSPTVTQIVLWVEEGSKKKKLFQILDNEKYYNPPIIIFVDSKIGADYLAKAIEKKFAITVLSLHSDKTQYERSDSLQQFMDGNFPILVSTPVLGRGIDLLKVTQVINFDMPSSISDYIHQVGRCGRRGTQGMAISFVNETNKKLFYSFVQLLNSSGVQFPPQLKCSISKKRARFNLSSTSSTVKNKRSKNQNKIQKTEFDEAGAKQKNWKAYENI